MKKPLIILSGPTASGKTKSSVLLAKKINGEIISADSMQVYRKMDIGTAKVKPEEMEGIPHHMIDVLDPDQPCNVSWFKEEVKQAINHIHQKGKIPILVGGTGFYLNAILYDTEFEEAKEDLAYREALFEDAKTHGIQSLHQRLEDFDPESAKNIPYQNVKRVVRALEYYHLTGECISAHNKREREKRDNAQSPYAFAFFVLTMPREKLYERINLRVDQMMAEGLLEEVTYFYNRGYSEDLTSMKAIGYKEFFPYLRGEQSLESSVELLKQSTRRYAKRQLTWFRHQANPHFIDVYQYNFSAEAVVSEIIKSLPFSV